MTGKPQYSKPKRSTTAHQTSTKDQHQQKIGILGDSMIKGLNPRKLQHGLNHKIIVKSFPSVHVEDMGNYVSQP